MLKTKIILASLVIALCANIAVAQKIAQETIEFAGTKRTYYLYVPRTAKSDGTAPLLVLLHGSNRNGLSLVEKWKDRADKEGIILVGPNSAKSATWSVPGDGPVFIYDLVEALKKKQAFNPRKVYLFGHSGGAIFALMLSMYESQYFAATAIHAGALFTDSAPLLDLPTRKIPIHLQVGTDDPLFPVKVVRSTRDALNSRGFFVELTEIPRHNHYYYDRAPEINEAAWRFLQKHELPDEPRFQQYSFRESERESGAALEHYNRGLELQRAGKIADAIASYTRAIEIDPKYASTYNNRGIAYLNSNDYARAIADFTRSIELQPSERTFNNRAGAYLIMKKYAEAIADLSEGIKLKPSAEAYTNRGIAYEQTAKPAFALDDYESAIKFDPKFGRAYILRGLIALRARNTESAQKDFARGFELDPSLHVEFDTIIKQLQR